MQYEIPRNYDLFIGNEWHRSSSSRSLDSISPLTGDVLCTVPDADERDVAAAVLAAQDAWRAWYRLGARKRADALLKLADALVADAERFAWLETTDTGKPWRESHANVLTAADRLRYFAGAARTLEGGAFAPGADILSYDVREPLGVVGIIGAWNFPLNMFVGKIAPAIAVGNAVVYKPAEATPITTLEFARLAGQYLPPGVVNVITGTGRGAGLSLVAHPDVRKVSLTGSSATGRAVMAAAAAAPKQITLELGGKNAQIVFADADLDRAAQGIVLGAFLNQGQMCTSGSRVFVHESIAAELQRRVLELVPRLRVGNPFDRATTVGAIAFERHLQSVLRYIDIGRSEGARLVTGGGRKQVPELPRGLFLEPTVFTDVMPDMVIAREEIFGPVLTWFTWTDEDAMLGTVNLLDYGLAAGIWTENLGRAHRTAAAVEAGRIWINCYNLFPSGSAFGGVKASGFGREDALETLLAFTHAKNVIADTSAQPRLFYK
jgi:acyl-CoA reductase-like NAD-dependent aldehyde dehydrogenase